MNQLIRNSLLQRARAAYQRGAWSEANDLAQSILTIKKEDVDALVILHMLGRVQRQPQQALAMGQRIIKAAPNQSIGYFMLSEFYLGLGDYEHGIALLNKWLKKAPNDADAIARLAEAFDRKGDPETSQRLLQPLIDRGAETPEMALLVASNAVQKKNGAAAVALLEKHLASPKTSDATRKDMCFTLGLALERLNRTDEAFEWYTRGHEILPYKFNIEQYLDQIERTIATFSPDAYARMPRARVRTSMPIFLVCRPRSGSTLAERIIGSHPQVRLAGELMSISRVAEQLNLAIGSTRVYPECVLDVDQNDIDVLATEFITTHNAQFKNPSRLTIKHLDLWQHIGLISLMLPDATIIDLRRDALDTCLACYSVHLGQRQPYNQNLRWLGQVHRAYERLMNHWQSLGIRMLRVDYENLVADQEHWSRQMIEFCGLPWDERCLRFNDTSGATVGATLSYQQVRQPIYKTSVGRAAKFSNHLGPLYEALHIQASSSLT